MIHILNAATLQQGLQEAAGRWHEVPVQLNGDWTPDINGLPNFHGSPDDCSLRALSDW
jgi:hypothetical protein